MLLNNKKYWFHSIVRIRYNDNCRQRTNRKNLGVERYPKYIQQAHSNVNWTGNICKPMDLITAIIGKETLTYREMKKKQDKPQFITEMQKEISDHPPIRNKWGKNYYGNLVFQAKKGKHHGKGEKIQRQNLCARWNAGGRHKQLGNVCPSGEMGER